MSRIASTLSSLSKLVGHSAARKWLLASAVALPLAGPAMAQAGGRSYDRDRHEDRPRVNIDFRIGGVAERCEPRYEERRVQVWCPPVYRTVCDRRWVEPVYRTVCDRRYVEPVFQTVCEKVWVPEVYQTREVRYFDGRCYRTRCERVLVCAGHFEARERRVCVSEGRWETCNRQECVSPGRWETCDRQECVAEGHYEWRSERVRAENVNPFAVVNPQLAGIGFQFGR